MKNIKIIMSIVIIIGLMASTVSAADIPLESAPCNATSGSIAFTENLISDILTKAQKGLGYADARNRANNRIFSAVIASQSDGYGYGILHL